jgi:sulfatase maturation enzyme AslB (radical SAM superfamily)
MLSNPDGLNLSLNWRVKLNIDSSSRCNLSCPGCNRTKAIESDTAHFNIEDMPMEYFVALTRPENKVDELVYNLTLSDPIYSGVFVQQLEHINTLNRRPKISISTNGSGRNEKWWLHLASLLRHDDRVGFAIDGMRDTNHIYRVNSKWDSIITGARTLRAAWPGKMIWRYIVFEHNYHQLSEAKELATDIGFNEFRPVLGDDRTPKQYKLISKDFDEIVDDIS